MSTGTASLTLPRRLAAIMFADMMGYTAMMQTDERRAISLRNRMRETLENTVRKHHGKVVQYYGDGMLILFESAADGVSSAIEIQIELQNEPVVPVRIGLHSGEVRYDDHGIYGDCVNVASRIESLSSSGAVLISDKVYDEIKNQADFGTKSLGMFNLKNVRRPIEVYALTNAGLVVPTGIHPSAKIGQERGVAVLPFLNLSTDPENEYFSDGISEEILNALSKVEGLQVCSRTSSFSFKGQQQDVRQIGQKLGVSAVLEGSVRRGGNKVRISAQLVNTVDGYHIWSETFDGSLDDIFTVQDEIAARIVDRLKIKLTPRDLQAGSTHASKTLTENVEAYNQYLKGRFHWNKSNPEEIRKAITAFEAAIELDPSFAAAYCMLSHCYSFMGSTGGMPYQEAFSKAKDLTLKAIEQDPNHAESHLSLASIKFLQNWDFDGAQISIHKARSLGLNSALLNEIDGLLLITRGRFHEAVDKIEQALRQEPLSLSMMCQLADAYAFARRFDEAHAQYDKAIELDPNFRRAFEGKGLTYLAQGVFDKAIENLEQYQKRIGHPLKGLAALGYAYALAGNKNKALECLEKTRQREIEQPGVNLNLEYAFLYSGLKDYDRSFEHFKSIYEHRTNVVCVGMIYCIRFPLLEDLKSRTPFKELVAKMGLE